MQYEAFRHNIQYIIKDKFKVCEKAKTKPFGVHMLKYVCMKCMCADMQTWTEKKQFTFYTYILWIYITRKHVKSNLYSVCLLCYCGNLLMEAESISSVVMSPWTAMGLWGSLLKRVWRKKIRKTSLFLIRSIIWLCILWFRFKWCPQQWLPWERLPRSRANQIASF